MIPPPPRPTLFPYTTLFRSLPNRNTTIEIEPEIIQLDKTLSSLEVTREQLVDIGILIGTDFNPDGFERIRSEEHTSELQSQFHLVCRLLLEKKKKKKKNIKRKKKKKKQKKRKKKKT